MLIGHLDFAHFLVCFGVWVGTVNRICPFARFKNQVVFLFPIAFNISLYIQVINLLSGRCMASIFFQCGMNFHSFDEQSS